MEEYDTNFVCTYKNLDDDDLYRIQYLQAFKLNNWNDNKIMNITNKLYYLTNSHFKEVFENLKTKKHNLGHLMLFFGEKYTEQDLFCMLFCIEVFQEFHMCLCNIINNGTIDKKNLKNLNEILFKS